VLCHQLDQVQVIVGLILGFLARGPWERDLDGPTSCTTLGFGCMTAFPVPLTVRLDPDTERCLRELQQESGLDRSSLIRQLIHDRWQQRQPPASVTARLGGHPAAFLTTLPAGSAERAACRELLAQRLLARRCNRS
jgi:hypothetical protein